MARGPRWDTGQQMEAASQLNVEQPGGDARAQFCEDTERRGDSGRFGSLAAEMAGPARAQAQGAQAPAGQPAAQTQKKLKDQGEYDIYNEVIKDITARISPKR